MNSSELRKPRIKPLTATQRKAVNVTKEGPIKTDYLRPGQTLPLLIQPTVEGVDLDTWAQPNQEFINDHLRTHGAILFRGFQADALEKFERFIKTVSGELLEYKDRSSPRHKVSGNIYTSTDYPADHHIFMHNENSYSYVWPLKLFFCCVQPAEQGGETPIADVRKVLQHISPATRQRFIEKGVMYMRNFGDGFGLSWQTVFQTTDRAVVEDYCRGTGIRAEWKEGNRLRTRQVRPAIARHPQTGEPVWFNHGAFFHISTLEASVRDALLAEFKEEDLPYNTYYGDGSPFEPAVLEEIRQAYKQEMIAFPWRAGDVLMIDNMLTAHGREPYVGQRKIVVGMSEPFSARASA